MKTTFFGHSLAEKLSDSRERALPLDPAGADTSDLFTDSTVSPKFCHGPLVLPSVAGADISAV